MPPEPAPTSRRRSATSSHLSRRAARPQPLPPPPPVPPSARRPVLGLVYAAGMSEDRVVEASKRLAAALRPGDLEQTLSNITAAAVEVLPDVHWSSLTIKHADGRLETVAPTADMLRELDAAQYELEEGPCYEAAVDTVHVVASHLAADERFPRYAPVALRAGIRAQAGIRLFDGPDSNGALNLYSDKVGAFE